jgi:hypothetical protein
MINQEMLSFREADLDQESVYVLNAGVSRQTSVEKKIIKVFIFA